MNKTFIIMTLFSILFACASPPMKSPQDPAIRNLASTNVSAKVHDHYVSQTLEYSEESTPYDYPSKKKLTLYGGRLGECFAYETSKTSFYSSGDEMQPVHTFAPSMKMPDYIQKLPEFWRYLGAWTREHDFVSGHEIELNNWVLGQNDNSVDPVQLYSESLKLCGGNVWNAILTVHNVVRENGRFFNWLYSSGTNLSTFSTDTMRKFFDKLIDLRGDLRELGGELHGDHRGTWYRLWTSMLLRMSKNKNGFFAIGLNAHGSYLNPLSKFFTNEFNDEVTAAEVTYDHLNDYYIDQDELDPRKGMINRVGVDSISKLYELLNEPKSSNDIKTSEMCKNRGYLKDSIF